MNTWPQILLAAEDQLSIAVLRQILSKCFPLIELQQIIPNSKSSRTGHGTIGVGSGYGAIQTSIPKFVSASKNGVNLVVLTDLDQKPCVSQLIHQWRIPQPLPENFLFCVAVRETEAWLLADRKNFSHYFKVSIDLVPYDPEKMDDPKREIVALAKKSKDSKLRKGICPPSNWTGPVGPDYNHHLMYFVDKFWDYRNAAEVAPSLARLLGKLDRTSQNRKLFIPR